MNTNQLVSLDPVDSNHVVSIQSSYCDKNDDSLLANKEIRNFFKSLLNYIPIVNLNRIDDLIKRHELYLTKLNLECDAVKCLNILHSIVLDAKQFGITLFDLRHKMNEKLQTISKEKLKLVKLRELKLLIDFLIDNYLILPVGVVEPIYVSHEFKQHWVILSYKSLKGRGNLDASSSNNNDVNLSEITETEETNNVSVEVEKEEIPVIELNQSVNEKRPKRTKMDETNSYASNVKNFKQVCLIPRPWRYIDGLLNRPVLKQMLESILIYLKTYPNSTAESICDHFCPVLQPIMTLELLKMLQQLKCVKCSVFKRESECDLFSDFTNGSCEMTENDDDLMGNEIFAYYLNQNSMFTFKKVFPD